MHIDIQENGCMDDEVKLLDTRLPYFYEHIKNLFSAEPQDINIILINSKNKFLKLRGKKTTEGAFAKENTIYIYEPRLFGIATPLARKDFYRALYQEIFYIFYRTNKSILT